MPERGLRKFTVLLRSQTGAWPTSVITSGPIDADELANILELEDEFGIVAHGVPEEQASHDVRSGVEMLLGLSSAGDHAVTP